MKRGHAFLFVAALCGVIVPPPPALAQSGPSFDCARAGIPAEFAICGSGELAALDRRLAEAYSTRRQAMDAAGRERLAEEQRAWLGRRNTCGIEAACLAAMMQERIAVLAGDGRPGAAGIWQPVSTSVLTYGPMTVSEGELRFSRATYSVAPVRAGGQVFRIEARQGEELFHCGPDAITHVALVPQEGRIALVEYAGAQAPPEPGGPDLLASTSGTGRCAIGWFER